MGEEQAREGYTFLYEGRIKACAECSLADVCHGKLKPHSVYRVVEVRDRRVECRVFGAALLVRVEPAEVEAALEAGKALESALVRFFPQECGLLECRYFNLCVPVGLEEDRICKIMKVSGFFTCPRRGIRLAWVSLLPQF